MEKKTEQLNIRISKELKDALRKEAERLDWTIGKLAERILREWTEGAPKTGGAMQFIVLRNESINIGG